jgi:hypothetical protein
MAIGINADSLQWTFLYNRLKEVGGNMMCGDYTNFDASLTQQMGMCLVKAANEFYDDSDENKLVRKVLMMTLFNSEHMVDNLVYSFKQGNPSGDALTSIINCVANMFLFRYAYLRTVSNDLRLFHAHVRCVFYGDDCIVSVSDVIKSKFNMLSVEQVLLKLGIIYTSASKDKIKEQFVPLNQVTFLKRRFVYEEEINGYLAPHDFSALSEIARWAEGDPLNIANQLARFNSTLLFASSYSEKIFNKWRKLFIKYCQELRRGVCLNGKDTVQFDFDSTLLFTYLRCKQINYPEFYKADALWNGK